MNGRRAAEILSGPLVIVTSRGVDLRLPVAGWDVVDVARVCAQIDALPETPHPLGGSA